MQKQNSVISEENTSTQTFEALANSFHQFFTKQDYFKIGCSLVGHSNSFIKRYISLYFIALFSEKNKGIFIAK